MPFEVGRIEAIYRYPVKSMRGERLTTLLLYAPGRDPGAPGDLPTHVRTPDGAEMPVFGEELAAEVGRRHGAAVQMMRLDHGTFDEAAISVITLATIDEVARLASVVPDVRRFRPNILLRPVSAEPFHEDKWVGGVLSFGDGDRAPAVAVTMRDVRCSMINFDPDSAQPTPDMLKAVVRVNQNNAGVYGAVSRIGALAVGQPVRFHPSGAS